MNKILITLLLAPILSFSQSYKLDSDGSAYTLKAHITTKQDVAEADKWLAFSGFAVVAGETSGNAARLLNDSTILIIKAGFYKLGGCIHYIDNLGAGFDELTVLSRVLINRTDEARCMQRGKTQDLRGNGEDVLSYNGTAYFNSGDVLNLQYFCNTAGLDFYSSSNFDQSVAATIWINFIGN